MKAAEYFFTDPVSNDSIGNQPDELTQGDFFSSISRTDLYDLVCKADSGDEEALRIIIRPFESLITSLAEEKASDLCSSDDLMNEGCIALLRAIQWSAKDENKNFPELAEQLIRRIISDAADLKYHEVSLSAVMLSRYKDIISKYERILEESGAAPSPEAMGLPADISPEEFGRFILHVKNTLGILSPLPVDGDASCEGDLFSKADIMDLGDESDFASVREQLLRSCDLSRLSERARKVLRMRFGLDGELPKDPNSIGMIMGISSYRVYQIEYNAMRRLGFRVRESGTDMRRT
jgi:RNA polymerase sigma factor (sigma-70 family)